MPGAQHPRFAHGIWGGVSLLLLLAISPLYADSAMYRGGSALTGAFPESLSLPLVLSWKHTTVYTAHNASSPAVVGDTIYFASGNRIYCVDANTGALQWQYPEDQPLTTYVSSSPAVADGMVFFGAYDGKLYAIDANTGKYRWAFDTRSTISSSPIIVNGTLYFGAGDGRIWALNSQTGVPLPTWKNGLQFFDEVSGALAYGNGMLYAVTRDQVLHAISPAAARERWNYRLPGNVLRISPVVSGEMVYVASGSNVLAFLSRNGIRRWMALLPSEAATSVAVGEDAVYVVTTDRAVYALDMRTGKGKWKSPPTLPYDVVAPPSLSGKLLFVGTLQGGVYAIDTETGVIRWSYQLRPSSTNTEGVVERTSVAAAPVIANQSLYILSDDGSLCAFRADAPDSSPPQITGLVPEMGIVINGEPPVRFEAVITDEGSGVNLASLQLMIDDQSVPKRPEGPENEDKPGFTFDPLTSRLEYSTPRPTSAAAVQPLADGRHTVTVIAADWKGNTATREWSFNVDNSLAKTELPRTTRTRRYDSALGPEGQMGRTTRRGRTGGTTGGGLGRGRRGGGAYY
jgi:outer membrane protein assembly factor BamB